MRKITRILGLLAMLIACQGMAQPNDSTRVLAEIPSEPVKGLSSWYSDMAYYLRNNYPEDYEMHTGHLKVFVQFVVEKDGSITNVEVARSCGVAAMDSFAIAALENTAGQWKPGKQGGRPVRQIMTVPIKLEGFKEEEKKRQRKNNR